MKSDVTAKNRDELYILTLYKGGGAYPRTCLKVGGRVRKRMSLLFFFTNLPYKRYLNFRSNDVLDDAVD